MAEVVPEDDGTVEFEEHDSQIGERHSDLNLRVVAHLPSGSIRVVEGNNGTRRTLDVKRHTGQKQAASVNYSHDVVVVLAEAVCYSPSEDSVCVDRVEKPSDGRYVGGEEVLMVGSGIDGEVMFDFLKRARLQITHFHC